MPTVASLQVVIGTDLTPLVTGLAAARAQVSAFATDMQAGAAAAGAAEQVDAKLGATAGAMGVAFKGADDAAKSLASSHQALNAAASSLTSQMGTLEQSIGRVAASHGTAATAANSHGVALRLLNDITSQFGVNLSGVTRTVDGAGTGLTQMGAALGGIGVAGAAAVAGVVALAAAVTAATIAAAGFDTELVKMQNNTLMTDADLKQAHDTILSLSATTGAPFDQLIAAEMKVQDVTNNTIATQQELKVATEGAIATGANVADVANTMAGAIHEYGLDVQGSTSDTDFQNKMLAVSVQMYGELHVAAALSRTDMEDWANSTSRATAIGAAFNVPLPQTNALLDSLTVHLNSASNAQTQYINILTHIANPTKEASAALDELNQKAGTNIQFGAAAASNPVGFINSLKAAYDKLGYSQDQQVQETMKIIQAQRGGVGAAIEVTNANLDLNKSYAVLNDSVVTNTAGTQAMERANETLGVQLGEVVGSVKSLAVAFGELIAKPVASWFSGLNQALQDFTGTALPVLNALNGTVATTPGGSSIPALSNPGTAGADIIQSQADDTSSTGTAASTNAHADVDASIKSLKDQAQISLDQIDAAKTQLRANADKAEAPGKKALDDANFALSQQQDRAAVQTDQVHDQDDAHIAALQKVVDGTEKAHAAAEALYETNVASIHDYYDPSIQALDDTIQRLQQQRQLTDEMAQSQETILNNQLKLAELNAMGDPAQRAALAARIQMDQLREGAAQRGQEEFGLSRTTAALSRFQNSGNPYLRSLAQGDTARLDELQAQDQQYGLINQPALASVYQQQQAASISQTASGAQRSIADAQSVEATVPLQQAKDQLTRQEQERLKYIQDQHKEELAQYNDQIGPEKAALDAATKAEQDRLAQIQAQTRAMQEYDDAIKLVVDGPLHAMEQSYTNDLAMLTNMAAPLLSATKNLDAISKSLQAGDDAAQDITAQVNNWTSGANTLTGASGVPPSEFQPAPTGGISAPGSTSGPDLGAAAKNVNAAAQAIGIAGGPGAAMVGIEIGLEIGKGILSVFTSGGTDQPIQPVLGNFTPGTGGGHPFAGSAAVRQRDMAVLGRAESEMGSQAWDGYCEAFVERMAGLPAEPTALAAWYDAVSKGRGYPGRLPQTPGEVVYFDYPGDGHAGHVGFYAGGDDFVSALDSPYGVTRMSMSEYARANNAPYLGSMPAYKDGGTFRVGGSGGADSQVVMFRASPQEVVSVSPPGQGGGGNQTVNIYLGSNLAGSVTQSRGATADEMEAAAHRAIETLFRTYTPQAIPGVPVGMPGHPVLPQ